MLQGMYKHRCMKFKFIDGCLEKIKLRAMLYKKFKKNYLKEKRKKEILQKATSWSSCIKIAFKHIFFYFVIISLSIYYIY